MENKEQLKISEILKKINNSREQLSALYNLYNASILVAQEEKSSIGSNYEQMVDCKNDLTDISTAILNTEKKERSFVVTKNMGKIKRIGGEMKEIKTSFDTSFSKFKMALKECGSLKTEYKKGINDLCKEFKVLIGENPDPMYVKGYNQQLKIIKTILNKIELLISNYNVNKNEVESGKERFDNLYSSAEDLKSKLESIA